MDYMDSLPVEMIIEIFDKLPKNDAIKLANTSNRMNLIWRKYKSKNEYKDFLELNNEVKMKLKLEKSDFSFEKWRLNDIRMLYLSDSDTYGKFTKVDLNKMFNVLNTRYAKVYKPITPRMTVYETEASFEKLKEQYRKDMKFYNQTLISKNIIKKIKEYLKNNKMSVRNQFKYTINNLDKNSFETLGY